MSIIESASSWDDLKEEVQDKGGTAIVTMAVIRDLAGFGKLGKHVNAQAALQMAANGLAHFPISSDDFPVYQHQNIRVFLKGKEVERLYQRMLRIADNGKQATSDDDFIVNAATNEARAKLEKVRAIICDD